MDRSVRWLCGLLVGMLLMVTGCEPPKPEADFVFIENAAHQSLDPQFMSWSNDIRIVASVYDPLVRMDFVKFEIEPATAESWTVSEDGLTYTFTLREGAVWSNGDPVVAGDYIYAWRRALMPDTAAQYAELLYCVKGAKAFYTWRSEQMGAYLQGETSAEAAQAALDEAFARFDETVGLEAVDDRTLVVTLEQPTPYFLEMVGFATFLPVHPASVNEASKLDPVTGTWKTDIEYWSDPTRLVSNGPFGIEERVFKQRLLLRKSATFWDSDRVKSETVLEKIIEDPMNGFLVYQKGGADLLFSIPSQGSMAKELIEQQRKDVHAERAAGTYFYNFNCLPELHDGTANPLADARVRRALSLAIDRDQIVNRVNRVGQPVAKSFVPPYAVEGYDPPVETAVTYDPEAARALLEEAGYPGGEGLDGLSILYNTGSGHENVALAIKAVWERELGVVVKTEGVEVKTFGSRIRNQDYTIARGAWFGDYVDPTTWLDKHRSTNGNNDTAWKNAEYDGLLDEAAEIRDRGARFAKLAEAEAVMNREQPIAPIYHYVTIYLFDPDRVQGANLNAWARWRFDRIHVENE